MVWQESTNFEWKLQEELFSMPCHSICDFILSITTSNVVWWDKNAKTTLQEAMLHPCPLFA
jgi:hypothetical protein